MVAIRENNTTKYLALAKKVPQYYKYTYSVFVQPLYDGSNISSILFSDSKFAAKASTTYSSRYNVFYLFNGEYATGGDNSGFDKIWESGSYSSNVNPWVKFSNPIPINVESIEFDFRVEHDSRVPKAVTIYAGNSNSTWVKVKDKTSFVQERTFQTVTLSYSGYYTGIYLYFDGSGGTGQYSVTEIANLTISATQRTLTPSSSSDYDVIIPKIHYFAENSIKNSTIRRCI